MNGEETYDTIQNTDLQESYQLPKKQNGQNDAETLSHKDELETENPLSASTISRVELADVNQLVRDDGTNKYMKREHLCENSQMVQNGKLDNNNNVEYLFKLLKKEKIKENLMHTNLIKIHF
ncbi:unnamed protein product [Heterobilharzia americana]|nr:unnamed protein product [Heterobilharzia americana]